VALNKQKLPHAAAFLWLVLSLFMGEVIYDAIDENGFLMRLFSFVIAAAPVWITYGWRWLTDNARFPLKISYFLITVSMVSVVGFLFEVYDYGDPSGGYILFALYAAAVGMFPWFFDGFPNKTRCFLQITLPKIDSHKWKRAQAGEKKQTRKEKIYLLFWGGIVPVAMYWLHAPPIMFFILAFFLFLAWWQRKAEDE